MHDLWHIVPKNVFSKGQPTGGAIAGQCEKCGICSLNVGICVQNVTEIVSCVHDLTLGVGTAASQSWGPIDFTIRVKIHQNKFALSSM